MSTTQEKVSRTTPSHSHTEAGTLRKRAQRACSQCHIHKTKCSGDLPKCKRCEAANLVCEYTPTRRRFTNVHFNSPSAEDQVPSTLQPLKAEENTTISPASSNGTGIASYILESANLQAEDMLLRRDVILTHLDAYFDFLYMVPCLGFLHPEATYRDVQSCFQENRFSPAQAAAVCSVTSFFVNQGPAGREFGRKCSQQVEMHIYRNMYKFSESALFLFALNILFNILDGSHAKVWQCFGVASRLMIGLQLNWDVSSHHSTFIQQECLRRVAWQLFSLDRLLAGGYEEYISCRAENMKIRLPCNEAAFRENRPVVAERLHDRPSRCSPALGLHGIQILLVDIRHRIQVATKRLAVPSRSAMAFLEPSKVMEDIAALQSELTRFHVSIHDELRLTDQSMSRYAASDQWRGYCFFHTHMAVSHIDLYRFSLPGPRSQASIEILRRLPPDFIARSQKQAVAHALSLARFLDAIKIETDRMPHPGVPKLVGDYSTAHMAAQCIRVLLIALQYNLYENLGDTTAPVWRGAETSEAQIKSLIETIMEITEAWSEIFDMAKQAHDCNKMMVEDFYKNGKILDRGNAAIITGQEPAEDKFIFGSDVLIERMDIPNMKDEQRSRAANMPVSDWWMGPTTAQQASSKTASPLTMPYHAAEVGFDGDYGPPGVPLFLAQARNVSMGISDIYDAETAAGMQPSEMLTMMPSNYQMMQAGALSGHGGIPMLRMDDAIPGQAMFRQDVPPPAQPQPYIPSQQGMMMNGYAPPPYPSGYASAPAYTQQNSFG
ncbi:Zn2Cys6 transcriptional regulator [Trichoderma cornu-damae]|uniref:Zn2Cys6 transcriptional regulator n=1 Tax=Trichoderma cornu-damae TaxID=654480 RepID=A0A9P8QQ98_9HYPO|nr:Zn2Cys6 transcriptional regulator [Trichoderma cornu-damae]